MTEVTLPLKKKNKNLRNTRNFGNDYTTLLWKINQYLFIHNLFYSKLVSV